MSAEYYIRFRPPYRPTRRAYKKWTTQDESFLILMDRACSVKVARTMGRSLQAIHLRRFQMGLTK